MTQETDNSELIAQWESCPVATQKCMAAECRNGCSIACRYEDVFHPDGRAKESREGPEL